MRFICAMACVLVGFDCAAKAMGLTQQAIYAADLAGLWWLHAVVWAGCALVVIVKGAA